MLNVTNRPERRFDAVRLFATLFSVVTAGVLVGMLLFLVVGSLPVLRSEGWSFLAENKWSYRHEIFGAAAMLYGTGVVAAIAIVLAAPVGIGTAIFSSEICPPRVRLGVKLLVELLAGIPSVVYGLLGVLFLRNWVYSGLEAMKLDPLSGDTLLTAGLLLAVMILPTVATLADDAMHSVPSKVRDAARGLGMTRAETVMSVVVPEAFPGIVGAVLLAIGRALGETIAVFLVVGRADNMLPESLSSLMPLIDAGQTITSKLGGAETNISVGDPLHTSAMLGLGLVLLVVVLAITLSADALRARLAKAVSR